MPNRSRDEHERSAAGLDFDERAGLRENAANIGQKMIEAGPDQFLDEIENLLPEEWREQIRTFPLAAVAVGIGVGVWLGMKKSDDILAAGTSLVSAAAMANVAQVMDRVNKGGR